MNLDAAAAWRYLRGVKTDLTVALSQELLDAIDELPADYRNRSFFFEAAAWAFIAQLRRAEQSVRDLEILNRRADYLNGELADTLEYQVER